MAKKQPATSHTSGSGTRKNYPAPVVIGYSCCLADGAEQILIPPKPPGSMTTEARQKQWYANPQEGPLALQNMLYDAAFSKVTGRIARVFAVLPLHGVIFDSQDLLADPNPELRDMPPAVAFVSWLLNFYPRAFRDYPNPHGLDAAGVAFYGFDVKEFVRVVGTECALHGQPVPIGLWYRNEECFDPYAMIVEEAQRKSLPLEALMTSLGLVVPADWQLHVDPAQDAVFAAELIHAFGLLMPDDDAALYGIVQSGLCTVAATGDEEPGDDADMEPEATDAADEEYAEGDEEYTDEPGEESAEGDEEYAEGDEGAEEYAEGDEEYVDEPGEESAEGDEEYAEGDEEYVDEPAEAEEAPPPPPPPASPRSRRRTN